MRSFIGVYCGYCHKYFRIYKDARAGRYQGRCFKCGRYASAIIDPVRGQKRRFFVGR